MTITEDRPAADARARGRQGPPPQGGRSDSSPAAPAGPTTSSCPGMLHLAMVRSPFAHARITSIDTDAAKAAPGVIAVVTGADIKDDPGRLANAWPITTEQKTPNHLPVAVDHVACAGEIVAVVAARTAAAARDAAELVDVDYDELPAVLDLKEARQGRGARASRPRHQQVCLLELDSAARAPAATSRTRSPRPATDGIVIEREFRQQRLIPAFMEPRSTVVDPTGEQMTVWTLDPGAAHPALPRRRDDRHPRVQGAHHRPRRRWRLRRQAPDDAGGVRDGRRRPPARQAVQVHRDPLGVAALRPPRPRPVAEADALRRRRTAPSPASRSSSSPTSAPTSASSAAVCRCSARGCTTRSTSSRPTTSPAGRC